MTGRIPPKSLAEQLRLDEDASPTVYKDSLGFFTIGIGRLCDPRKPGSGLTQDEMTYLLNNDITAKRSAALQVMPWLVNLDRVRSDGVLNMCFQLGVEGVLAFKDMIAALKVGNYVLAASASQDSTWAKQTPERAARIAQQLLTGLYQ